MQDAKPAPAAAGKTATQARPYETQAKYIMYAALLALVLIAIGSLIPGVKSLRLPPQPLVAWIALAVLTVAVLTSAAYIANGRWIGFLIDERNRTSLSRLQIGMWTVIALSAFLSIALARALPGALTNTTASCPPPQGAEGNAEMSAPEPGPLQIRFPAELLVALGISSASFAGSSLVKSSKRAKQPVLIADLNARKASAANAFAAAEAEFNSVDARYKEKLRAFKTAGPDNARKSAGDAAREHPALAKLSAERAAAKLKMETAAQEKTAADKAAASAEVKVGTLKVNDSPADATIADMFQGNEVGNYNLIDLSKVQMFFFTVAIGVAYCAALVNLLTGDQSVILNACGVSLPPFNASMNTLLAISHAGYIATQSVDHTKTSPV